MSNHPQWLPLALLALGLSAVMVLLGRVPAALAPLAAVAAVGWTLQLEQLWLIARNPLEGGAALLLLGALLAGSLAALMRLAGQPLKARFEAGATLLLGSLAAILSLWQLFDPRYRDFFFSGFLPPALFALLLMRSRPPVVRRGEEEIAIGALLLLSAIAIVVAEKPANHQALAWGFANVLLACGLLWRGTRAIRTPAAAG